MKKTESDGSSSRVNDEQKGSFQMDEPNKDNLDASRDEEIERLLARFREDAPADKPAQEKTEEPVEDENTETEVSSNREDMNTAKEHKVAALFAENEEDVLPKEQDHGDKEENVQQTEQPEIKIGTKPETFTLDLKKDKSYRKIRNYHKVKNRKQHRFLRFLFHLFLSLCILAIAGGLGYVVLEAVTEVLGINQDSKEIIVEIPEGTSLTGISEILEAEGVVKSAVLFKGFDRYADVAGEYQFGTFVLNTEMSYEEIMTELKRYNIAKETVRVTFPEGSNLFEISQLLEDNGVCPADEFLSALNTTNFNYDFMPDVKNTEMKYFKMEGYAFPDTYDFYLDDNPVSVAQKFLSNLDRKLTRQMVQRMNELNINYEELLILASIVQAEGITDEQMRTISSIYWNRLNHSDIFPLLQSDPTRVYGREIKKHMQIINREMIDAYDTYTTKGLPPGPICNPGLDAILAALYPAETDYYYFCSDLSTGECYYAVTLEEHEQNLRICGLR